MAAELNIKRCWFHKDHYDIPARRVAEIEARCLKVTPRDIVKITGGRIKWSKIQPMESPLP